MFYGLKLMWTNVILVLNLNQKLERECYRKVWDTVEERYRWGSGRGLQYTRQSDHRWRSEFQNCRHTSGQSSATSTESPDSASVRSQQQRVSTVPLRTGLGRRLGSIDNTSDTSPLEWQSDPLMSNECDR